MIDTDTQTYSKKVWGPAVILNQRYRLRRARSLVSLSCLGRLLSLANRLCARRLDAKNGQCLVALPTTGDTD